MPYWTQSTCGTDPIPLSPSHHQSHIIANNPSTTTALPHHPGGSFQHEIFIIELQNIVLAFGELHLRCFKFSRSHTTKSTTHQAEMLQARQKKTQPQRLCYLSSHGLLSIPIVTAERLGIISHAAHLPPQQRKKYPLTYSHSSYSCQQIPHTPINTTILHSRNQTYKNKQRNTHNNHHYTINFQFVDINYNASFSPFTILW